MRSSSFVFFAALGVLSGCSNQGALGQAVVGSGCPASNPSCGAAGLDAPVAAGVGVTLAVELTLQGGGAPPLTLLSGNDEVFTVSGQTLTGVGSGVASLLFTAPDGIVLDFTTVWVQMASALVLQRRTADGAILGDMPGSLQLLAGDAVPVSVSARSGTQPLSGAPPATWSADPTVVSILDEGIPGRARLVARAPGKATVTVSALGLQQSFTVEVLP
jgi:hypothetical protein